MTIKRIQVEEGFLNGLDLTFSAGLNVLIGPRGAGKTSIIELIRFCLDVEPLTDKVAASAREHALSILGPGRVSLTVEQNGQDLVVSRSAEVWQASRKTDIRSPVILSQNEIEELGLSAPARLKLLDSLRVHSNMPANDKETALVSYIRSQTEQRRSIVRELQATRQQIKELTESLANAEEQKKQYTEAVTGVEKAKAQNQRISTLSMWLSQLSVRGSYYQRLAATLQQRLLRLQTFTSASTSIEAWPSAAGSDDPMEEVRTLITSADIRVADAIRDIESAILSVRKFDAFNREQMTQFDQELRTLRRQLEELQQGAGEASRRLTQLQEKVGQLSALKDLERQKSALLQQLQQERKTRLDELEAIRSQRFLERAGIVEELNREFNPRIKIELERAGLNNEYASSIASALRGSGLRFNEAASIIANEVSPREFVDLIESENATELARITGLSLSRAERIIERIREEGVEDILTVSVEDSVTISLLDGKEYKTTEHLSMGQRCTVVLPLILKQTHAPLIVDQPEDHLDNGFIVDTLIKAIANRKSRGQLIFSTHNANIPVLGGADTVTLLGSDGSRGFVRHSKPLEHPDSVDAITNIMEGGKEAFDRRAQFYSFMALES